MYKNSVTTYSERKTNKSPTIWSSMLFNISKSQSCICKSKSLLNYMYYSLVRKEKARLHTRALGDVLGNTGVQIVIENGCRQIHGQMPAKNVNRAALTSIHINRYNFLIKLFIWNTVLNFYSATVEQTRWIRRIRQDERSSPASLRKM